MPKLSHLRLFFSPRTSTYATLPTCETMTGSLIFVGSRAQWNLDGYIGAQTILNHTLLVPHLLSIKLYLY